MNITRSLGCWAIAAFLIGLNTLSVNLFAATPNVAGIFSDNMVLQRDVRVPIWGWANAGEVIEVEFAGSRRSATTDVDGRWLVWLDPMKPSFEGRTLVARNATGDWQRSFSNTLVGEIWFCSGQSNANMHLYKSYHSETTIALANLSNLRWYIVRNEPTRDGPDADAIGNWATTTPESAWEYSAYGYFFAEALLHQIDAPIGVIQGAYGGTPCEAWISREAMQASPAGRELIEFWNGKSEFFAPEANLSVMEKLATLGYPAYYYNARVAPVIPYAMRGAIWYQGESNRFRPHQYSELFPLMVGDWRQRWGIGNFPFYYVQLANIKNEDDRDSEWPMLQYVQTQCLDAIPNSGMAIANDSIHNDLHPKDKRQVGQRLALHALAKTYDRDIPSDGPIYKRMQIEAGQIRLFFTHTDGGLAIRGDPRIYSDSLRPKKTFALQGFEIREEGKPFVEATAEIEGDAVIVSSQECPNPVAVRYAWTSNAISANLTNGSGLPASLFRTDNEYPSIYYNIDPLARK